MFETICLFGGVLLVMLLGLAGSVLPVIPCVPTIWLGAAGYGLLDGFRHLSLPAFLILTLFGVVGATAELWATQLGARTGGASGCSALSGSCVGGLVLLFFSLPIAILAALASVFGLELLRGQETGQAARGAGGWLAGWALSAVVQFSIGLFMILFFLWQVLS